jgi:hypothetical protein
MQKKHPFIKLGQLKMVRFMTKETNLRMLEAFQNKPLRTMELSKITNIKSRNVISAFIKEGLRNGLLEIIGVEAEDRPAAIAYRLTSSGYEVLFHFREIERLSSATKNQS